MRRQGPVPNGTGPRARVREGSRFGLAQCAGELFDEVLGVLDTD